MQALQLLKCLPARGLLAVLLLCALSAGARAWSDHASLLWPLVRSMPEMREATLRAESLTAFVEAEAAGLAALLEEHETASGETIPFYAALPDALVFRAGSGNPRRAFLEAIRVNPLLPYRLYRQRTPEETLPPDAAPLRWSDVSFLGVGESHRAAQYVPLAPDAPVTPAQVIASGSDEPDFGMDIGLFADNDTEFGARYGFGTQPFGNPNLEYGSQAPFHMGFYHLDWLTRKAQPDLLRTLPEWRVSLFGALARFAFDTGHDYWGWRFMGWALHYIGDLTQPYHAEPLPGVSTFDALWLVVRGRTGEAIQLVSNRHGVLESYQFQRVAEALRARDWEDPILRAIRAGGAAPAFQERTVRDALSVESSAAGDAVDAALLTHVPARFVADPTFEWTGSGEESAIVATVRAESGEAAVEALDAMVAEQMRRFSRYARAWIERGLLWSGQ